MSRIRTQDIQPGRLALTIGLATASFIFLMTLTTFAEPGCVAERKNRKPLKSPIELLEPQHESLIEDSPEDSGSFITVTFTWTAPEGYDIDHYVLELVQKPQSILQPMRITVPGDQQTAEKRLGKRCGAEMVYRWKIEAVTTSGKHLFSKERTFLIPDRSG